MTVSDEGNGFDCDVIETSDAKAGLGLISLRERASYIGGELEIESKPGQGSRFILKTPLELEITEKTLMPHIHIIGLSMFEDEHVTATMRQAGAEEFVSKTASSSELINAIYKVFKQQKRSQS